MRKTNEIIIRTGKKGEEDCRVMMLMKTQLKIQGKVQVRI